jgi:3-oxoacyl-[acyl-carrier protein] reductase
LYFLLENQIDKKSAIINMLEGKTILITGSSRGIGAATAKLAKGYGANVIVHGRTESADLDKIAKELGVEKVVFDISDPKATHKALNTLLEKGIKIDGLANVAGIVIRGDVLGMTDEEWINVFKTNVLGTMHTCQILIPHMQANHSGRIVNIGSVRAYPQGTLASRLPYCVSKAAVVNLTVALAKEFAKDGIHINSVSPGGVETDIAKTWDEETRKRNSDVLLKRIGKPVEIGDMICFLLSDKAGYITGQDYLVDGGYLVNR